MASQQDIHAAGAENRPPMLSKGGSSQWASRMMRYLKSKSNGKLLINSIVNGPFKPIQVLDPGDPNGTLPVQPFYRDQNETEYTEQDRQQIVADDQTFHYIVLGLPETTYATVDSEVSAHAVWERVKRLMYGTDIGKQDMETQLLKELCKFTSIPGESIESYYLRFCKIMNDLSRHNLSQTNIANNTNFLNELQPEWGRYVTIVYQTKNLHEVTYDQLYDFLKQNQDEANEVRAEILAKKHDPLALMANTPTPLPVNTQQQPSSSSTHNYMQPSYIQQPTPVYQQQFYPQQQQHVIPQQQYPQILEPEFTDNDEASAALTQAFAFLTKAFQGRYSTPTNNNQRISSNTRNKQIAQPSFNTGNGGQMVKVYGNQQGYATGFHMGN
jgi:hypothetical protein